MKLEPVYKSGYHNDSLGEVSFYDRFQQQIDSKLPSRLFWYYYSKIGIGGAFNTYVLAYLRSMNIEDA
jgi:hypothetical protein